MAGLTIQDPAVFTAVLQSSNIYPRGYHPTGGWHLPGGLGPPGRHQGLPGNPVKSCRATPVRW